MPNAKNIFWYSAADADDHRYELPGYLWYDHSDRATVAAEDYNNHDGWESRWPLVFTIYETEDGPAVARFEVQREDEPTFIPYEMPEI